MSKSESVYRMREFSHAFFLATLLVAVVSVMGAVLSLTIFVQQQGGIIARGATAPPPTSPPTVSVDRTSVPVGGIVRVTVQNGPGNPDDCLGVYPANAPPEDGSYAFLIGAKYLNGSSDEPPNPGLTTATVSFTASSPGTYHARFLENCGTTVLATSPNVTVPVSAVPEVSPPPQPIGKPLVEPSPMGPSPVAAGPLPADVKPLPVPLPTAPTVLVTSPPAFDLQRAATTAALVAVAVATPTTAVTALAAAASVPGGFAGLSSSFLPFPLAWVRPRRRPWGRVVEERTNLPVAGAVVTVLDASGRPRENVSSRNDGTFGALLPRGTYQFSVQHPRFAFASAPEGITLFPEERLYRGGSLDVKGEEGMAPLTPLVIGMKPIGPRHVRVGERLRSRFERLRVFQAQAAIPITLTGAAINSFALWMNPTPLLVSYEILYGVFLIFETLLSRVARRTLGRVRDAVAKSPVGLAIVRLLDIKTKRVVATRVTTSRGSFLLMPPPGNYRLQVSHAAYAPYTSDPLRIGRGGASAVRLKVDLVPGETSGTRAI